MPWSGGSPENWFPPPEYLLSKWFDPSKLLVTPPVLDVTGTEAAEGGRTFPFRTDEPPCGEFSRASTSGLLISSEPRTSPGLGRLDAVAAFPRVESAGRSPT
jgi:hypothetical protein